MVEEIVKNDNQATGVDGGGQGNQVGKSKKVGQSKKDGYSRVKRTKKKFK